MFKKNNVSSFNTNTKNKLGIKRPPGLKHKTDFQPKMKVK